MPESLWCFVTDDRLLTMADSGEARIWTVTGDGWLVLSQGRPRQDEPGWKPVHEPPSSPPTADQVESAAHDNT